MEPYVLEGLDCSGKKTIGRLVEQHLAERGIPVRRIIGPLVMGPFGRLDAYLSNLNKDLGRTDLLSRMRQVVYVAGPIVDELFYQRPPNTVVLKISSHYRAWARAIIENDQLMRAGFRCGRRLHLRFAGATLLNAAFDARLARHRAAVSAGETSKDESRRFLGYDSEAFRLWHATLDSLMSAEIRALLRVDTSTADPADVAERVYRHVLECCRL